MNILINKFCNLLMRSGNKTKARALLMEGFTLFLRGITQNSTTPLGAKQKLAAHHSLMPVKKLKVEKLPNPVLKGSTSYAELTPLREPKVGYIRSSSSICLSQGQQKNNIIPENILDTIIENVRPCIEIRKVRVARATYQVPAQIGKSKGQTIALRWIIEFAKKAKVSNKISFPEALAEQLKMALKKQGPVRERRSKLHRLAEANRSYMRYRWW